jgi:tripartite-type tricarboxylate transporter receptor subunit TctC
MISAACFVIIACTIAGMGGAGAEEYPTRPVTLIVPFAAGGGSDVQARLIAKELGGRLGKPVIIDNRPGAGGSIGTALAAKAKPDGHTLLFGSITTFVVEPVIRKDVGYSVLRDFEAITIATTSAAVLVVNAAFPARSVNDLLDMARKRPGELTYASVGPGSTSHLFTEAFKSAAKVDIVHVPYKGEGPAMADLVGGQVSMMFSSMPAALQHIRAGKLRALAVRGSKRNAALPEVPALREAGVAGVEMEAWWGFVAPAKTPADVISRLNRELVAALRSPQLVQALDRQGVSVAATSPAEFVEQVRSQTEVISNLVKSIDFKLEE